jgi:hypothetical protein
MTVGSGSIIIVVIHAWPLLIRGSRAAGVPAEVKSARAFAGETFPDLSYADTYKVEVASTGAAAIVTAVEPVAHLKRVPPTGVEQLGSGAVREMLTGDGGTGVTGAV